MCFSDIPSSNNNSLVMTHFAPKKMNLLKLDFAHISYTEFAQHVRRNESFQIEVSTKKDMSTKLVLHMLVYFRKAR